MYMYMYMYVYQLFVVGGSRRSGRVFVPPSKGALHSRYCNCVIAQGESVESGATLAAAVGARVKESVTLRVLISIRFRWHHRVQH